MRARALLFPLLLLLGACRPAEEGHGKAIIGAVLIDGLGGPPLSDSVVVIEGSRIREAGPRAAVTIPDDADRVDGAGKFLVPELVDVFAGSAADSRRPATPQEAREQVALAIRQKEHAVHLWSLDPAIAQATLESARDAGVAVIGHVSTQAGVRSLAAGGAAGFIGMIADTEKLDPVLLASLRDLRIFFAPALGLAGASLDVARRNTRRLFAGSVPIALASNGGDPIHECELLSQSGIPPLDVLVAATRNGAAALGQADRGTIQAGQRAGLLLLSANPGEDVANLRKVVLRMSDGNWVK